MGEPVKFEDEVTLEGSDADERTYSQFLFEMHFNAARVAHIVSGVLLLSLTVFSLWTLIAWDIKAHEHASGVADSSYAKCLAILSPGLPHADRFCGSVIPWTEKDAILWVFIPLVLTWIVYIVFSLDYFSSRTYDNNGGKDAWTMYKTNIGINSSLNAIEMHGVNPRMHILRFFLVTAWFCLNAMVSTNRDITALGLSFLAGGAYAIFGLVAERASHKDGALLDFIIPFFGQTLVLAGYMIIIGYFNVRVYIDGAKHYECVVIGQALIFFITFVIDWALPAVNLVLRAVSDKNEPEGLTLEVVETSSYDLIETDDEAEVTVKSTQQVQPYFLWFFSAVWTREILFIAAYSAAVYFTFGYHMANGLPVLL